mmetsp:Transcript_11089/g.38520  ORF Transcript_11089/g.38520 Transcript_11089/m.38520 type:complete len:108 (+) Transcript_11089:68-391(+)
MNFLERSDSVSSSSSASSERSTEQDLFSPVVAFLMEGVAEIKRCEWKARGLKVAPEMNATKRSSVSPHDTKFYGGQMMRGWSVERNSWTAESANYDDDDPDERKSCN